MKHNTDNSRLIYADLQSLGINAAIDSVLVHKPPQNHIEAATFYHTPAMFHYTIQFGNEDDMNLYKIAGKFTHPWITMRVNAYA